MQGLSAARTRTYFSRITWVSLPYDQISFSPQVRCTSTQGATSGSWVPLRQPWVRNTGQKTPNWYLV